jgi:D-aminopeptidase
VTGQPAPRQGRLALAGLSHRPTPTHPPVPDSALDPLFVAAIEVTEEAILNSLLAADTMTGFRGHVRHAVPLDRVRQLCAARGVLQPAM